MINLDLSKLPEEELKKLKENITLELSKPKKHPFIINDIGITDFNTRTDLMDENNFPVYVSKYDVIHKHIIPSIFTLCDWTLGNYEYKGTNAWHTEIFKRCREIKIEDMDLYSEMISELKDIVLKYNNLAFEKEESK